MQIPSELLEKLLLSMLIGGIIGAEREFRSKSAGFRTMMLISMGATLFTMVSLDFGGNSTADRIASNIVVGIGFVGAGVIFVAADSRVNGITTAATIWVTASLGMAIGAGKEKLAIIACIMVLVILLIFTRIEDMIERRNQIRTYRIVCLFENTTLHRYEDLFRVHHLRHKRSRQTKSGDMITGEWLVQGSESSHRACVKDILLDERVKEFIF